MRGSQNLILESLHDRRELLNESKDFKEKHGIKVVQTGLGFSEKEQKWYGWSHRAYYGFGIGHKVKKGHVGYEELGDFECKTLEDCRKVAEIFAKSVS